MSEPLKSPFYNDPFALIAQAFENLYPGTKYIAYMNGNLVDRESTEDKVWGLTTFPADGSEPVIEVSGEPSICVAVETFAHELAHVAAGKEHEHDEMWEASFDKIHQEYNRLGEKLFGDEKSEKEATHD